MTAESVMKANPIAVSTGVYDFSAADRLVSFCQANGIALRGHNLLWHQTAPAWFFAGNTSDPSYKSTVTQRLKTYITDVVTHFKGKVYCWDVCNEVASDDASSNYRTNSPWYQALGPDYIEIAFRAAYAADPAVALFINDYSTEYGDKLGRLMAIVDDLIAKGVPINGVGHQLHNNINVPVSGVANALAAVEARHLINHITELDLSVFTDSTTTSLSTAALATALQAQATSYRALFNLFVAHPSVQSVTMWGTDDAHSWLNSWPITRNDYPLLFDRLGNPKSAYWAVVDPTFVP